MTTILAIGPGGALANCWEDRAGRPFLCCFAGDVSCAVPIVLRYGENQPLDLKEKLKKWGYRNIRMEKKNARLKLRGDDAQRPGPAV